MALVRRSRSTLAAPKLYIGFTRYGTLFKSHEPVTNTGTNFLKYLIEKVTTEYLPPASALLVITAQAKELQQLFSLETMGQWFKLERFYQWPLANAARSSEVTVKFMGRAYPLWHEDENAWYAMVRRAEQARGQRPHTEVLEMNGQQFEVPKGVELSAFAGALIEGKMGAVLGHAQ